jgi:hypothetical protein
MSMDRNPAFCAFPAKSRRGDPKCRAGYDGEEAGDGGALPCGG